MLRNGSSTCQVSHDRGSREMPFTRETVEELLAADDFFWLDLDRHAAADFEVLRGSFGFHPLAVEDSEHFEQRAKIDDYEDFVFLVVYGASPDDDRLVEVHCFYSERFLVTVHRDDCPAFAEIRRRYQKRDEAIDRPSRVSSSDATTVAASPIQAGAQVRTVCRARPGGSCLWSVPVACPRTSPRLFLLGGQRKGTS